MPAPTITPGFHQHFNLQLFTDAERKILTFLSKGWRLNRHVPPFSVGTASYRGFLMKPIDDTAAMFGLDREIMAIFSDYNSFEPRTLDAFDTLQDSLPSLRVEELCRVLISTDGDIEGKISRLVKAKPEQPVVIPFSYSELFTAQDLNFVLNRFRQCFFSRNLFDFLSPLTSDLYFYGRQQLVHELINKHRSLEHAGLFGLRKSGKTSVVLAIARFLRGNDGRSVLIDCESTDVHQRRWYQLLELVAQQYHQSLDSNVKRPADGSYTAANAGKQFEEDITRIYESRKRIPTLFIFDEIERITPGTASSEHWQQDRDFIYFWQNLRGFYQRFPGVYTYMLVGTNPSAVEKSTLTDHDNPLFASVPSQYMPNFTAPQVAEMVTQLGRYMGLIFDDAIAHRLTEDFGGHPFLIRQACSLIHKYATGSRPVKVDRPMYEKVKNDYVAESGEYLDMIVDVLRRSYPDEYEMLTFLATGQIKNFAEFHNDDPMLTRHLKGYGLIQSSDHGVVFNIESLRQHLERAHRFERTNLTDEQKHLELVERRNGIERKLRDVLGKALKILYGQKARDHVLAALPEGRREAMKGLPYDDLLSTDKSPLFLLELKSLVGREWEALKNVFAADKSRVEIMLDDINRYGRADSHAKGISDDDFTQVRLHMTRLEEWLDAW